MEQTSIAFLPDFDSWYPIPGYEGSYEITDFGLVRSINREENNSIGNKRFLKGKPIKPGLDKDCYMDVALSIGCETKQFRIHRLVATIFIPNPENKLFVNHINGFKWDNRKQNLEWTTQSENELHNYRVLGRVVSGAFSNTFGERQQREKLKGTFKPIARYDKEMNLVESFINVEDAYRKGFTRKSLRHACNTGVLYKGHYWKWAAE